LIEPTALRLHPTKCWAMARHDPRYSASQYKRIIERSRRHVVWNEWWGRISSSVLGKLGSLRRWRSFLSSTSTRDKSIHWLEPSRRTVYWCRLVGCPDCTRPKAVSINSINYSTWHIQCDAPFLTPPETRKRSYRWQTRVSLPQASHGLTKARRTWWNETADRRQFCFIQFYFTMCDGLKNAGIVKSSQLHQNDVSRPRPTSSFEVKQMNIKLIWHGKMCDCFKYYISKNIWRQSTVLC